MSRRRSVAAVLPVVGLLCLGLCACGAGPLGAGKSSGTVDGARSRRDEGQREDRRAQVSEAELQQRLQRIASDFMSRVNEAADGLMKDAPFEKRTEILRRSLAYDSSILDIATGPFPSTNMLDMVVFAEIAGDSLERHFLPEVVGAAGRPLLVAFEVLRTEVWSTAADLLSEQDLGRLRRLIAAWEQENPDRRRVEGLRLLDIASVAGRAEGERTSEARGLLGTVRAATATADRAFLLAEQGSFLVQRLPFLWRAHVRLSALELTGDTGVILEQLESVVGRTRELGPMLADASALLERAERVALEARILSERIGPELERTTRLVESEDLARVLSTADRMSGRTLAALDRLRDLSNHAPEAAASRVGAEIDAIFRRLALYLALAGAFFSLCFWSGYYVVRRVAARDQRRRPS